MHVSLLKSDGLCRSLQAGISGEHCRPRWQRPAPLRHPSGHLRLPWATGCTRRWHRMGHLGHGKGKRKLPLPGAGTSCAASLSLVDPTSRTWAASPAWQRCALDPQGCAGRAACNEGVDGRRVLRVPCREAEQGTSQSQSFSITQPQFLLASLWSCSLKKPHVYPHSTAGSREMGPPYSRERLWKFPAPSGLNMVPGGKLGWSVARRRWLWRPGLRFLSGFWQVG